MKNKYLLLITLVALATSGCVDINRKNASVTIDKKNYTLKLAQTEEERRIGLSGISSLDKNSGMLFTFEDKARHSFWMKDTLVPLQIIFIDGCEIVDIQEMKVEENPQDPQKVYTPSEAIDKAIELNSGSVSKDVLGSKIDQLCQ